MPINTALGWAFGALFSSEFVKVLLFTAGFVFSRLGGAGSNDLLARSGA